MATQNLFLVHHTFPIPILKETLLRIFFGGKIAKAVRLVPEKKYIKNVEAKFSEAPLS